MVIVSSLQTLPLKGLEQGHTYTLVVTNAGSAATLQFKHASDATFRTHPTFTGTPTSGVILAQFVCISPDMQLVFGSNPASPYYLSVVCHASAQF